MSNYFAMEPQAKIALHPYGDRMLFYAEADDKSWSLPLFVEFRIDREADIHYAHIVPAFCPYVNQALALKALLQPHDIQGREDQWIVTRRMAEALLHKAPGITPRFYYRWITDDCPPIERSPLDINVDLKKPRAARPTWDSFAQFLSKERNISVSIINAVLRGIADEGPKWMIEHRQPLDLGFCRLISAPFRANWKEIVAFKTKFLKLRKLLRLPEADVWKALEEIDLPSILTSPHNVGLRRGWRNETDVVRIDYSIEAIPSEKFESEANRIEGKRISRGGAAYITEFEDTVEALYKSLVLALRSYLAKVAKSYAVVLPGSRSRILGFVPVRGRNLEVRGTALSRLPIRITPTDSGFSIFGASDDANLVCAKAPALPEVSTTVPSIDDVREREVEGRSRLLLQDADPCNSSTQPMLAGGEAAGDGLAEEIMGSLI